MKLDDKYTQQTGSVYLTGMQALVRLPMDQMRRDRLANLNTATFISGYEGSPLGTYDLALSRAKACDRVTLIGDSGLIKSMGNWFGLMPFAGVKPQRLSA